TDSVTITWTTDEASDSLVRYDTAPGTYTDSEPNTTMVTSHSIMLTGLSLNTTYYFVVNSTDASDNSNESEEHNFTTAAIGPPELISCVITPTPSVVQGTNVSIDCLFSEGVDYEIRIENATGALTENIGSGTATNPDPKWWNTTTETPAGTYTVNVTMYNSTSGLSSYNNTNTIEVTTAEDTTPPAVIDHAPTGTGAPVSTNITATFNESMNPDTLNNETVTVEHNGTAVAGNITYAAPSKTVTFDPADDLNYSETYNVTITTGVQDIAGNNMSSNVTWNFTTSSTEAIISIGNVSGNMTVPIVIENAANVGSAHINITYNASVCTITDVANGTFDLTFANLEHNETGWVRIGAIHTEESGLYGSIILANVTFRSNSTNGTSPLNLSVITLKDATPQCNEIPYIVQNGTYTAVLNGDVNGDGKVDIADAMYLAKHVIGITGFEEIIEEAADVDGEDGIIDIADAMYLAKHVLGKSGFEELR
ncbi:MAG: Ig-like domain-containing protein, partial [Euryarchaeota archaeon]|nr:Ig-like domain-containing protein [Euryarchaeota archaeon]